MMGRTHKAGGALAMVIAYNIGLKKGLLLPDIAPWVQMLVMYPCSSWGSTISDTDQGAENAIPEKTPVSLVLHKALHAQKGKCVHRSWQTHSVYFTGALCVAAILFTRVFEYIGLGYFESNMLRLMIYGVSVGVLSHLFMDLLSIDGIWLLPGVKIRFVPKRAYFKTGSDSKWELLVQRVTYILIVLVVVKILYDWLYINDMIPESILYFIDYLKIGLDTILGQIKQGILDLFSNLLKG